MGFSLRIAVKKSTISDLVPTSVNFIISPPYKRGGRYAVTTLLLTAVGILLR
nr:MAG TPA: hypothetical protein [Caudoviricetes sp.]